MIGHIEGKILATDGRMMIVDVGGIGYAVATTEMTLKEAVVGRTIKLWTHLSVKEDALDLFGFLGREELALFKLLIGISGIGPKSALNILSLADVETLLRYIGAGDSGALTKVSGIGKKLSEKIVLELKEKVGGFAMPPAPLSAEGEALDALESLGYMPRDTRELVRTLARDNAPTKEIIRKALQTLGGRQ